MRSEAGSQVVHYRGGAGGGSGHLPARRGEAEEEWVTKKKVEITTTKNVERKIQRQLVLEDGRVVEEEVPTVTVDTSEDKQTFETDHDEDRRVEAGSGMDMIHTKFNSRGGLLVGDKFTSIKKVQDVKENLVKTEAVQNLGDIASRDVEKVIRDKEDIRKYLRRREDSTDNSRALAVPRTVYNKRNHRIITDKEDIQERNWLNDGQMQNERIKTEEHIEYDSDDTPESGSSSSMSNSSKHVLEPEVYKTRKDENFTEYFKVGHTNGKEHRIKIGDGPHFVSESKEVEREEDRRLADHINSSPRLTHLSSTRSKKPVTHTDSWLERHFGSSSSSLSASSVDLSRSGGGGLRRSASICDIRPVTETSNVYYATVRKTGKVPPAVVRRERKDDYYIQNRQSANFSSSGHPIRPPRKKKTDSDSSNCTTTYGTTTEIIYGTPKRKPEYVYGTLRRDGPNGSFTFEREEDKDEDMKSRGGGRASPREDNKRRTAASRIAEQKENIYHGSRQEPAIRSQTPTERAKSGNSNNLPDRYFFGNTISGLSNSKLNNSRTSHHHSSSNIRSYSPLPNKLVGRSSKSHHQSTGNIYSSHMDKEKRENKKNRFGSSSDLTFQKYYKSDEPPISPIVRESPRHHLRSKHEPLPSPPPPPPPPVVTGRLREDAAVDKSRTGRVMREIPIMTVGSSSPPPPIRTPRGSATAKSASSSARDIPVQVVGGKQQMTRELYNSKTVSPAPQPQHYATTTIARREVYSSRDNIYSSRDNIYSSRDNTIYSSPQQPASRTEGRSVYPARTDDKTADRDIYARSRKDRERDDSRDIYGNSSVARDIYAKSDSRDIYAKSDSRDIYSSSRTSRNMYARSDSRDIYASPHHRIVYSTESPVGSPSTKYRTRIVLNGGLA